ncbi:MAG: alpha-L-fucosidase [Bacteroidales bacterium]|nr:alpha-L-fucosidase [Bacteroidales bacterium]
MSKLFLVILAFTALCTFAQKTAPVPVGPVPTERQLAWHEMEQYAFVHFTTNTFTDKEWGYGDESELVFNPTAFNAEQWVKTLKSAGLKALILTCKHHDGFCLWPSKYTEHSVKNSPFRNGKGDVVQEVSDACQKYGLKFGVYLSPWDRNHTFYGNAEYLDYYRNQLTELFTYYGPVFEMWFDGANGGDGFYGGTREKRNINASTYYQWPVTLGLVRKMQPGVLFFSDAGPDIRWCGNESGYAGSTNWCTLSVDTLYAGKSGVEKLLNSGDENGNKWIPAEVDVSIRPGWFYHAKEDTLVRTAENLFDIYLKSVGRGSNLLLNIPPDRRGLFNEADSISLMQWKNLLDETFSVNLAFKSTVIATTHRGNSPEFSAKNLVDGNKETYWATDNNTKTAAIEIDLGHKQNVKYIVIQEYMKLGQRVKSFSIEVWNTNKWQLVANETTIGYKRIIKMDPVLTDKIRIQITDSKACPVISNIEVY